MDYENNDYEGMESEVSEDSFNQTSEEQQRWIEEPTASRQERKQFDKTAIGTVERYADKRSDGDKITSSTTCSSSIQTSSKLRSTHAFRHRISRDVLTTVATTLPALLQCS